MAHLKKLWLLIPFFCVFLMSHNTFAANGSQTFTTAQGAYGYYIGGNYGRNVSFSGSIPLELITGSTTTDKALFGTVVNFSNIPSYITDTDQYHTINWYYTLSASNNNIDWESNESRVPITLSQTMGGTTTNYTDKCNYVLSNNDLGVVCSLSYSQGQRPSSVAITLGRTGVFTFGTDTPLGYSYYSNTSPFVGATIKLSEVRMTWTSSGTDQSGVIDSVNNVNNTVNNFYNAESGAADNISGQSEPDVGDNSKGTSILNTAATLFNEIISVPKGVNCQIPADWGNINLGLIDFCQGKENFSFIVNFVSSISVVVIVIGTSLILVRQILSLYDWARGK